MTDLTEGLVAVAALVYLWHNADNLTLAGVIMFVVLFAGMCVRDAYLSYLHIGGRCQGVGQCADCDETKDGKWTP